MKLKKGAVKGSLTGAIGIEAIVALRRIGIEPDYRYGVAQSRRRGSPFRPPLYYRLHRQ